MHCIYREPITVTTDTDTSTIEQPSVSPVADHEHVYDDPVSPYESVVYDYLELQG